MTMARFLAYFGIYLASGVIIASIFRLTLYYSMFNLRGRLLRPNSFEIFNEVMFWPGLLIFLSFLFFESLAGLLWEIGNCVLWIFKKWRRK